MAKMRTYTYWISYELPDKKYGEPESFGIRKKTRRELKKEIDILSSEGSVCSRPQKVVLRYWNIIDLLEDIKACGFMYEPWDEIDSKLRGLWEEGFETSELAGKV